MKVCGVIMAGGGGTRFWPLSRQKTPKQLLSLSGKDLMINEAVDRLKNITDEEIFIVTNEKQYEKILKAVSSRQNIKKITVIKEPASRNTAACIGLAAINIIRKYGDGIMCITPADHCIKNEQEFEKTLKTALKEAEKNSIVTIGIQPEIPATGFGYIKFDKKDEEKSKRVLEFKEKPDKETAQQYIKSGEYLWNSGMFITKATLIMAEIEKYLPKTHKGLTEIYKALGTEQEERIISEKYKKMQDISIDYGILEKSEKVRVVPGSFGWNDVGSWDMMSALHEPDAKGNILIGDVINIDTENTTVYADSKLVTVIGIENIIVAETPDAVLICSKEKAQEVKKAVEILKKQKRTELL